MATEVTDSSLLTSNDATAAAAALVSSIPEVPVTASGETKRTSATSSSSAAASTTASSSGSSSEAKYQPASGPRTASGAPKRKRAPVSIAKSALYQGFRGSVPRKLLSVAGKQWVYYDFGPTEVMPLVMLHGTSCTAECFFQQVSSLGARGYRVISAQFPPYWRVEDFVAGFHQFLVQLKLKKIHLFGASLGGYLALHYTVAHMDRVESLALCNAFADTRPFHQSDNCVKVFGYLPEFYLKKYILESFPDESENPEAVDFVVDQLESLGRQELGARLTLNCIKNPVLGDTSQMDQSKVTLLHSNDEVVLPGGMRARLLERFPNAKEALLKEGGDFPYLASPDEVNLMLQVHLRSNGLFPDIGKRMSTDGNSSSNDTETKTAATPIQTADAPAAASTVFLKLSQPGGGGSQVLPDDPEALRQLAPKVEVSSSSSSSSNYPSATSTTAPTTSTATTAAAATAFISSSPPAAATDTPQQSAATATVTATAKDTDGAGAVAVAVAADDEDEAAWIARVQAKAEEEKAAEVKAANAAAAHAAAVSRAAEEQTAAALAAKRHQALLAQMGVNTEPQFSD